jgi:hypothetical protein
MADGLLSDVLGAIDRQKQRTKASLGLLFSNPQEWAAQAVEQTLPTRAEEKQFREVKMADGDITQTPYYKKMFNISQMQGSIKSSKNQDGLLDYMISHRPMTEQGGASRLHEAFKAFGEDVYGKNALQYFGSGLLGEKTSLNILQKVRGNPNAEVTIYRGVPSNVKSINTGDWVTLDPKMAAEYGNVISKKVKSSDLTTWPDSLVEFGYYPSK